MLASDLAALRHKLTHARGELKGYWDHFLALARHDADWFGYYQPLAYLVTGDAVFRQQTRAMFLRYVELAPEAWLAQEAQFHTHVTAAPLGRLAALYDWIADSDVLSASERAAVAAAMLDHAQRFPLQQLHGRTLTGFDNQVMANAFGCTAVGAALGRRPGHDPLADRLLGLGLAWLRQLFALMPPGAYSLEGSTYNEQVAVPVALWSTILYEQLTGQEIFFAGLPRGTTSTHRMLTLIQRIVSPGGLLPPWDAYGWQRLSSRQLLVYLARRTQDPEPLRVLRAVDAWRVLDHSAWECDDRLWCLAWWPEDLDSTGAPAWEPWLEPLTAGALQDGPTRTRLFQYWDQTGGMPHCGRSEVDPNAIALEAFGAPLLMDGAGHLDETLTPLPAATILPYAEAVVRGLQQRWGKVDASTLAPAIAHAVSGYVGKSNALHFDGEDWYAPKRAAHGHGLYVHAAGPLQVLASDAADYYQDRYDVTQVQRLSALVGGRYVVSVDRVQAASEHRVTWQVYTAPATTAAGHAVVAATRDLVGLRILPEATDAVPELTPAPDFPAASSWARGSMRVRYHGTTTGGVYSRAFCLVPYPLLVPLPEAGDHINTGWSADFGAQQVAGVDLRHANLSDPCTTPQQPRRFRRTLHLAQEVAQAYLRLPFGSPHTVCRLDGQVVPALCGELAERWERETGPSTGMPRLYDLGARLTAGAHEIELETPFFHGETLEGPVALLQPVPATPAVTFARTGPASFGVTVDGAQDWLLLDNQAPSATVGGYETDAQHALVAADGALAFLRVTRIRGPEGFSFTSRVPVDIGCPAGGALDLGGITDGDALCLERDGARLRLEATGWASLSLAAPAATSWTLRLRSAAARPLYLNGIPSGWLAPDAWRTVSLPAAAPAGPAPGDGSAYTLAAGQDTAPLLRRLDAPAWTDRLAAVDALALLGEATAAPRLLALLQEELRLPADPPLPCWWRHAKMLHAPGPATPDPTVMDPDAASKRWRLRRALVDALGRLGHQLAIPVLRTMLTRPDYFCVTAQVPLALARLQASAALPDLREQAQHPEINTQVAVLLAIAYLEGRLSTAELEQRAGPG